MAGGTLPQYASDIPLLVANDRYQVVIIPDRGTDTTTAEFRYFYAGAPLWGETLSTTTSLPAFYHTDENAYYTPGTVELPFQPARASEFIVDGVVVEFNVRPKDLIEGTVTTSFSVGYSGHVEVVGVVAEERTVGSLTTGINTSTTFTYATTASAMNASAWPNTRAQYHPVHFGRAQAARVVLTDVHLVEIVRVQLLGTQLPKRVT